MLAGLALLPACGFTPLYGEQSAARALQNQIAFEIPDDRLGFEIRERLETRLGPARSPAYSLKLVVDLTESERAIRPDRTITRFNIDAEADFFIESLSTGNVVYQDSVQAFTAYSAVASPFATRAAEEDANSRIAEALADQILLKLATTAEDWAE